MDLWTTAVGLCQYKSNIETPNIALHTIVVAHTGRTEMLLYTVI